MDKQQFLQHIKHMSPETIVEVYHPIFEELRCRIGNMSQEYETLKMQKEEQDKQFDKLLSRIKTISTE